MKTLVQGAIAKHIPELIIRLHTEGDLFGRYSWSFRCVASEDLEGGEDGFESEIEALAHFAGDQNKTLDESLGPSDDDEEDE